MAYLSIANKLSINRIIQPDITGNLSGCGKDTYILQLEFGNHVPASSNATTPFKVSTWKDISGNSRDFTQIGESNMPQWTGHGYNFDGNNQFMSQVVSADAITLDGVFTIGFAIKMGAAPSNLVTVADASSANDFIRIKNSEQIEIKADGQLRTIDLNSELPNGDPVGIVITRNESHGLRVYIDGTAQADTTSFTGPKPLDIDTVGCRNSQINDFIGEIGEVIIYSCIEDGIVDDVIDRIDEVRVQMIQ